jgi:hypothetical protein
MIIVGLLISLWVVATLWDIGLLDKLLPAGFEDALIDWGIIGSCALYSVSLLDRNPFVRHFFLWVYALGFVTLSIFRGRIVHWASWEWQDATWFIVSVLKIACLFGFLHLAFLAAKDYKKIRHQQQTTDVLP